MKKIILFLLLSIATYGQIVPSGQEQDFDYGIRNTASQLDDNAVFLTVQDATGVHGKSTSSVWAKKIYVDNADAKKQFLSTGLLKNGLLQANVNTTLFDITAGTGIISNFDNPDAPTSDIIIFPSFTGILSPYLTTSNITYVAINSVPSVVMQASKFTDSQRRDLIILGAIVHSNLSTINTINNISAPANADTNQLHDLMEAIGALNISGNKYSANGANLSLNKSAGDIFKLGINFANNWKDPHKLTIDAQTLLTLRYRTQNGTEGADVTVLNPSVYDLNNVLTAVPSNRFSIQTVTLFQSGITRVQYGQNTYATMAEAEAAINTRAYVVEPNIALNGIARAYIILKNSTTSLQNASDAKIVEAQKFGGSTSGGVALTNASIIAALGFTPANNADVIHKTGNEEKTGSLTTTSGSDNFIANQTGSGLNFVGQNLGSTTFTVNKLGGAYFADNVGIKTTMGLGDLSVKDQVIIDDGQISWGFSANSGIISWDSGKSMIRGLSGNSLSFGSNNIDDRLVLNTSGVLNVANLSGTGDRVLSANSTGDVIISLAPTAPTATPGTNTTQIATTAFVQANTLPFISHLQYDNTDKTIWNNGKSGLNTNTSFGRLAFNSNTIGVSNSVYGYSSLSFNSDGSGNVAIGDFAGAYSSSVGGFQNQHSTNSVFLGKQTVSADNNVGHSNEIVIGYTAIGRGTNTATLGNDSIISTYLKGKVIANNVIRLKNYTVATLPTGAQGDTAYVTDALTPTYLGVLVGGGSVVCPVFYDGAAWVSH